MKRIVIIDGNSLINRAFYAMQRPMITKDGIYTHGIYGFLNMLSKIRDDYSPEYAAVAFDLKAPTFRHNMYGGYKAGRKPMPPELAMQLPLLKDILNAMNIRVIEKEGYEADDILGTISAYAEKNGIEALLFTGDKDALQLCSDKTKVIFTKKGVTDFELYDRQKMLDRYSLTPEQFIDLKAIMGDSSDNIPGISGIGEKGGIDLLTEFGSLDNLLRRTDEIKKPATKKKVEAGAESAKLSRTLATIIRDVPLDIDMDGMRLTEPDYGKLVELYKKLEFRSFLKKLDNIGAGVSKKSRRAPAGEFTGKKYIINSPESLESAGLGDVDGETEYFIRIFGDFTHTGKPTAEGILLISRDAYYFDVAALGEKAVIGLLNSIKPKIYGHDIKDEIYYLLHAGLVDFEISFDTAIAEYCMDVTKSRYNLADICIERLGYPLPKTEDFTEADQMNMFTDTSENYLNYGIALFQAIDSLRHIQEAIIEEEELGKVYYDCELPLIEVLASMELEGINVDTAYLDEFGKRLNVETASLEKSIYELAGFEFNIKSPKQLGEVLFDKLKLPHGKKNKTGYSTGIEVLEKLKDYNPIIGLILEYRNLTKLESTYISGMKHLVADDGRVHCHFQQTVTATGRISCTEPNLQNIPIRQELGRRIRKAFFADEGKTFVGADYSQIELRVLAHLSGDEALIDAFNRGEDIHKLTASRILGISPDEVGIDDRSKAKAVNFGVIYGMSGFGLSEEIKTGRKEAERYIKEYFAKHPKVKSFMDAQIESAREKGYSTTILGRKRNIHEIGASNFMVRQLGERLAMNSPIQGSAADIIKLAMCRVYERLKYEHPRSRLILQVHDELIIEAENNELEEIKRILRESMEEAMELKIKLSVELNAAENWYDLK